MPLPHVSPHSLINPTPFLSLHRHPRKATYTLSDRECDIAFKSILGNSMHCSHSLAATWKKFFVFAFAFYQCKYTIWASTHGARTRIWEWESDVAVVHMINTFSVRAHSHQESRSESESEKDQRINGRHKWNFCFRVRFRLVWTQLYSHEEWTKLKIAFAFAFVLWERRF